MVGASSVSEGVDDNINEINLIIDAPAPISTDYTYNTPDYALADVAGSVKNVVTTEVSARKDNDDADKLVPQMQNVTNVYYSDFSDYGVTITSYHEINNIGINLSNYPETREAICCFLNNPNSSKSENKDTKGRVTERRFRQQLKGESACQELVIRYEWEENRIVMIRCQMKGLETVEIFEYNDEGYMIKAT